MGAMPVAVLPVARLVQRPPEARRHARPAPDAAPSVVVFRRSKTHTPCASATLACPGRGTTLPGRAAGEREYCASTSALLPYAAIDPFACSTSILSTLARMLGRCAITISVTPRFL